MREQPPHIRTHAQHVHLCLLPTAKPTLIILVDKLENGSHLFTISVSQECVCVCLDCLSVPCCAFYICSFFFPFKIKKKKKSLFPGLHRSTKRTEVLSYYTQNLLLMCVFIMHSIKKVTHLLIKVIQITILKYS